MLWKVSLIVSFLCGLLSLQKLSWAQDLRRIHYGTTNSTSHLPVWVAKDAGYFAKNGLNVEPVHIRGGALITMGIMSGQLQFSGAGAESIVAARIEGGDVVLLACPVYSDPVYLMARPEIKSAAELKGKSTAVTRLGSTTHFISGPRSVMSVSIRKRISPFYNSVPDRRSSALWRRDVSRPPR